MGWGHGAWGHSVDSSEPAISLATANAELNGLTATTTFVRAEVSDYMKAAVAAGTQFDIVVLDPPKLAPDRNTLARARVKWPRRRQELPATAQVRVAAA
ncbi:Ribosomal RNA large subunit methyltransferase I [Tetrabaena socialis]|uniref:Ribosomal RNA large subunit methyltransferase I n=1 Tax=Tetrabaena socialis TaxID=47790 RepID=A0A2J8AA24_9CHLO|nr:Ribosomal RNA large subunit methyltransferase I [Tetrabaena socialis]|eukprot:PNH09377.1 Ribosomal RNA large subunit methyltransferase I [Tetrabaena socialis]